MNPTEIAVKNIDDVLWKEAGCSSELDFTEQSPPSANIGQQFGSKRLQRLEDPLLGI